MPFARLDRADAVGDRCDRQQTTISTLMQAAEPALDVQALQLKTDGQRAAEGCWPQRQELLVALQQVRQWLDQLTLQALTESGHRQQPAVLQTLRLILQCLPGISRICQRRFEQTVAEAVTLQRIQDKGFFIGQRHFCRLEEDLQSLAEKVPYRIAQEILHLTETQWFVLNVGPEHFGACLLLCRLMKDLPFGGVAERLIPVVKVASTEGLQWVFPGHGFQQILVALQHSPTAGQVVTQLADQHRGRPLAVIADAATHPTDVELVPCRQQGFQ
ncbi:hypothetical protein D3C72_779770 [compost metagenome]